MPTDVKAIVSIVVLLVAAIPLAMAHRNAD